MKKIYIIALSTFFGLSTYLTAENLTQPEASSQITSEVQGLVVKHRNKALLIEYIEHDGIYLSEKQKQQLSQGNVLVTESNSKAYIRINDGSKILMHEKSKIKIDGDRSIKVVNGRVLFSIAKKKNAQKEFKVATRLASLGIRGTQFLVDVANENDGNVEVYLKEGDISAYPVKDQFRVYQEGFNQEFEGYKENFNNEFESYKRQQAEGFAQYKKEITLKKGAGISISGNTVSDSGYSKTLEELFNQFNDKSIDW
jgi:ferric-dicitrate binding protein FerR (iron transport regulator)